MPVYFLVEDKKGKQINVLVFIFYLQPDIESSDKVMFTLNTVICSKQAQLIDNNQSTSINL